MRTYKATIGLEIHAELKTRTKMFCNSKNDSEEKRPNVNVCPICMGHPGTLPVINKEAVKHVLRVGIAAKGTIADFSEFDRKNYFYPDIPKGYQISQYKHPLITGGMISGIALSRIHLEEDTASSSHEEEHSLVNFNRAGVPLMELVTEPVIENGTQAVAFAKELQLLLQYLGAGDANMEKGEMRVEANISVSADSTLGTKVEVKNLNSFKAVEHAIEFEIERQSKLLDRGEKVAQETRGFDETKGITFSQRTKEDSHDYRYFPDPDLPKLFISEIPEFNTQVLSKELPELPWERRERYIKKFSLRASDAEIFLQNDFLREMFEAVTEHVKNDPELIRLAGNYIVSDMAGLLRDSAIQGSQTNIKTDFFIEIIKMIKEGTLSSRGAKDTLKILYETGKSPKEIVSEKGLAQKNDLEELGSIVTKIIEKNPEVVSKYLSGKEASLQFLVGQGMKESKGSANPKALAELIKE
ncbi:MAG: Asp-tRNA(Asn)/Glu-tRNA(Gln) amidotransferase subunit GatB, partial [Patescibacteria group bacterium]|nr:Asp-tRNA(Asn)/Glu-tRNA(Gln) amidotransferase subunit GatB [Patescibacteria group bacterium]